MITRLLSRLLNIRPAEWPRLVVLSTMLFVTNAGLIWGKIVVESTFLQQLGVTRLPVVLVLSAVISIVAVVIYTPFTDRVANDRLLITICLLTAAGIGLGLFFLGQGLIGLAYPLLYLLFLMFLDIFNLHWETYINSFYDTRSAKRVLPVVAAADRVAAILAGLSLPLLRAVMLPAGIITIWLGSLLVVALLVWLLPALLREHPGGPLPGPGTGETRRAHPPVMENLQEGFRYVAGSSYLRWMALSTLLIFFLLALLNYQTSAVLVREFQTEQEMTNFLALVNSGANLLMLPVLLFGLGRFVGRMGLGNSSLLFPLGTLAIVGGLIVRPGQLAAALAYANRTAFRSAIRNPIDSLLYNAVPLRLKGRARAFIGGFVLPLGTLLGGLLLVLPGSTSLLPVVMIGAGVAYLLVTLIIRHSYGQALIQLLEQEDFSALISAEPSGLIVADPATLNVLRQKLAESDRPELTLFIAQLISQLGDSEAVSILGQAARAAEDARVRAGILELLEAADIRGETARQLYSSFLADPASQVRLAALVGLEEVTGVDDPQFQQLALGLVSDPDTPVRGQALLLLAHSSNFYHLEGAVQALENLLVDPDAGRRALGVRVLGQIGDVRAGRRLIACLADPADQVRLEVILALETLAGNWEIIRLIELSPAHVSPLLHDRVQRVRQGSLILLGRLGSGEAQQALVGALADPSPEIRATAVEALVQMGKTAILAVHPNLDSPDPQLRKMSSVVLSRINRRDFGPLIGTHVTGNLLVVYRNFNRMSALAPYESYSGITVMQSALLEQNRQMLDEIFYLLGALYEPENIRVIHESLQSQAGRVRSNALEALEAMAGVQTARLVGPLFEPDLPPAQLLPLSREAWEMPELDFLGAVKGLVGDPANPWFRAIMTFAVGEIGADGRGTANGEGTGAGPVEGKAQVRPDPSGGLPDSGDRPKRRRPRPSDLLDALAGDNPAEASPVPAGTAPGPLTLAQVREMIEAAYTDRYVEVRLAARAARMMLAGRQLTELKPEEVVVLSTIEKIIFLKQVPFFQGMTIDQLRTLADVCEEEFFEADRQIFSQEEPGGALYVIVNGKVGIEQEKRSGSFVRLATVGPRSYFGEMSLFDSAPRSASAITLQDTLTLKLRREPLIALARRYPDLSLELISVLSQRLREANLRIAELTKTRPRELQKLFDQLE